MEKLKFEKFTKQNKERGNKFKQYNSDMNIQKFEVRLNFVE